MVLVKIHKSYRYVVTICDSDLLGKKFEQGKFQLYIKENFYNGEETKEEKAIEIMKDMKKEDATFNIVGEKSVNTALKAGIINKQGIRKIQEIPYSLVLL